MACLRPPTTARASSYQPECQFDQSCNDDCAEDNELSENKRWLVGRANFDYYVVLKRASTSRPSGEWSDDDFDVLAEGIVVGRIMKAAAAAQLPSVEA